MDIEGNLAAFSRDRRPDARYASFDYCYNYFQAFREQGRVADLAAPENMQVSCLSAGLLPGQLGHAPRIFDPASQERAALRAGHRGDRRRPG